MFKRNTLRQTILLYCYHSSYERPWGEREMQQRAHFLIVNHQFKAIITWQTSSQSTTLNARGIKSFIFPIIEHFVSGVCTSCTGLKWAPHAQGIRRNVRIAEHTRNKSHMWISQLFLSCVGDEAAHFQETHVHVSFWSDKQTSPGQTRGHCGITLC